MEEDRMPKEIFTQELEETRRRGRPRKRWKEEVEREFAFRCEYRSTAGHKLRITRTL